MKRKKYFKDLFWNTLGVSLNSFLIMLLLIVITRINGIKISGFFSFAFSFCAIIQTITMYGGRNYQVSDVTNKIDDNSYLSTKMITTVLGIVAAFIYFLIFRQNEETLLFITLIMIIKIIETFSDVFYAILQKNNELDIVGKSYVLKNIIGFIVFTLIDYITKSVPISIVGMIGVNILLFIIYDYKKTVKLTKPKINLNSKCLIVLKECFYFFFYNFLILLIANISRFTVNNLLSSKELGYYGILIMIPSIMTLFGQFLITPSLVNLSKLYQKKDIKGFIKELRKVFIFSIGISLVFIICAYFLGEQVLSILYSISFKGYKIVFVEFIIIGLLNAFTLIISNALTVMRKTKYQVYLYLTTLVLGIASSYLLTKNYGFNGAINSYLITMGIQFLLFLIYFIIVIKRSKK